MSKVETHGRIRDHWEFQVAHLKQPARWADMEARRYRRQFYDAVESVPFVVIQHDYVISEEIINILLSV